MHTGCYFLIMMLGISACVSRPQGTASVSPHGDSLLQGIQGQVLWLEGNQMPSIVEDTAAVRESAGKPVSRTVYIYALTHRDQTTMEQGFYMDIDSPLITKVSTSEDGFFQVFLPPGRYSLFVKEPQGLYANLYDGEGNIHPVTVMHDSVSQLTFTIDYKAVY